MDFAKLRTTNTLAKLQEAVEKQSKKKTMGDDPNEYWTPTLDKTGNSSAKLRFLPAPPQDGDDGLPWIMYFRYSFRGNGGWYINKSLASIDLADPCAEYTSKLWASKLEANINMARNYNRQTTYEANVEILQDSGNPENDGLVRKFKFGKKIWAKLQEAMDGTEDRAKYDPFSFFEGADFRLKIKKVSATMKNGERKEFPNYDDSYFLERAARSDDDEFLEQLWKKEFALKPIMDPKSFKSYDELLKDLTRALGFSPSDKITPPSTIQIVEREISKPSTIETTTKVVSPPWESESTEDDSFDLNYFKKLGEDS